MRTLAADLGSRLGGGAHLRALRRTRVGSFGLDEAAPVASRRAGAAAGARPTPSATSTPLLVDDDLAAAVGHGKVLPGGTLGVAGPGPWRVLGRRRPAARRLRAPPAPTTSSRRWSLAASSVAAVTERRRDQVLRLPQDECPAPAAGTAVTIGTYDGVHRGHRAVIAELKRQADEPGPGVGGRHLRPPPGRGHPARAGAPPAHQPRARGGAAGATGVDRVVVLTFDEAPVQGAGRGLRARGAGRAASA